MVLEEKLKEYDNALYGSYGMGVIFVEKDNLYGIINTDGEEILDCQFPEYSDAYAEWQDMGFPNKPIIMNEKQKKIQEFKNNLIGVHNDLMDSGDIGTISFDGNTIIGAELITLSDGSIGIAASVNTTGKKALEIKNLNGQHIMSLADFDPDNYDLYEICSDENNLYVGVYNSKSAYVTCYRMGNFERVWKTELPGSQIQSITVNDSEVIAFDMGYNCIRYFDKQTGVESIDKGIKTNGWNQIINATNERLMAGQPGFVWNEFLKFDNELRVYDNATTALMTERTVPISVGELNGIAIDKVNSRMFLAFDDKVGVFDESGYQGIFFMPTRNIQSLHFDQKTGSLMISMKEGKGKVELFSPQAISTLIETSQQLKESMGNTSKLQG